MKKNILIVIDMQNDFIDGVLGTKEARAIVPKVKAKINQYCLEEKEHSSLIYVTRDTHFGETYEEIAKRYCNTQEGRWLPVPHCIKGSVGWELNEEIKAVMPASALVYDKNTFGSISLAEDLKKRYGEEEITIELVGLCTDICVISNAMLLKAYLPEVEITVDASCCAGVTPESHRNALEAMKMCQIHIV